eukprot:CAMPEP_0115880886 /NCGR_PEP_ID=MMETSP0287-20121206/28122_1 /TAXON_ID=412157 /ORGANISM="Chrysochromulina rotalis, Strain UIO044" /LENGTH=112 /DNA_ID=CAMNT_0003336751 /DNA_START=181 /DNA_END=519 /DNA_ORIENTATION=+
MTASSERLPLSSAARTLTDPPSSGAPSHRYQSPEAGSTSAGTHERPPSSETSTAATTPPPTSVLHPRREADVPSRPSASLVRAMPTAAPAVDVRFALRQIVGGLESIEGVEG